MEIHKVNSKRKSFLRARYSSILAGSAANENYELETRILNLEARNNSEEKSQESHEDNLHLNVYLRMKKVSNWDLYNLLDDKTLISKAPKGIQVRQGISFKKMYTFNKIFGPDAVQSDLFDYVKLKVAHFINGYNCSLLTYGASGSGKTYTIVGTASAPGIIPRALEHIFRSLPSLPTEPQIKPNPTGGITQLNDVNKKKEKLATRSLLDKFNAVDHHQHSRTYRAMQQQLLGDLIPEVVHTTSDVSLGVWVSYAEIYNECIYDLLKPEVLRGQTKQKLRLGQSNGNTYIKDLTCLNVSSGLEAYQILQYGRDNLKYASTSVNDHSSRSHAIFTITLAQTSKVENGVSVSSFNFCDLAGSERSKKTKNVGERLKESNNINTSLLVLGRCIQLIRDSQKFKDGRLIPFRESKLTQLFQKALSGQEAISMIVNINPVLEMYSETQQVLNFSAIVKDVALEEQEVKIHELKNKFVQHLNNSNISLMDIVEEDDDEYEMEELQAEFVELYDYLTHLKEDSTAYQNELKNRYKKLVEDNENYGEKRYQDLKEKIEAQRVAKRKTSIIVLDSSTDQEESFGENYADEIKKLGEKKKTYELEINKKKEELKVSQERNKELNETILDAKDSYLQLESEYSSATATLYKQISFECNEITEAKMIYEDLHRQLAEKLKNQEESKNSTAENVGEAKMIYEDLQSQLTEKLKNQEESKNSTAENVGEAKMIYEDLQSQLTEKLKNQEESKNSTTENVAEAKMIDEDLQSQLTEKLKNQEESKNYTAENVAEAKMIYEDLQSQLTEKLKNREESKNSTAENVAEAKMIYEDLQGQLTEKLKNQEESKNSTAENVVEAKMIYEDLQSQLTEKLKNREESKNSTAENVVEAKMIYEDLLRQLMEKLKNQEESKNSTAENVSNETKINETVIL